MEKFQEVTGIRTVECGLFVSHSHPMLAASPDRLLDTDTLMQVKCPYASRGMIISERTVPYLTLVDGNLTLKKNHNYFYQVQGQLFCAQRQLCKFVIYTIKDIKIIDIPIDHCFIQRMLKELQSFFDNVFRKALIEKLFYKHTNTFVDMILN